jgi:hypothetical protein
MSATGTAPDTASSTSRVGGCGQPASRHPRPRTHRPGRALAAAAATRRAASALERQSSSRGCSSPIAHVAKCVWASEKPGQHASPAEVDGVGAVVVERRDPPARDREPSASGVRSSSVWMIPPVSRVVCTGRVISG